MPKMIGGQGSDHETYMMSLLGARLAYLEELPRGHVLDLAKLKQISGTAEITGRYLYRDQLTFRATHLLVVNTNSSCATIVIRRLHAHPGFSFDVVDRTHGSGSPRPTPGRRCPPSPDGPAGGCRDSAPGDRGVTRAS